MKDGDHIKFLKGISFIMIIEGDNKKKTTLGDDASIYKKREEKKAKEKFRELDSAGKWQFFKDYVLAKLLLGIAVVGLLVYMAYVIFGPKVESILYTAVYTNPFTQNDIDSLKEDLSDMMVTDPDTEGVFFDTSFTMSDAEVAGMYKFVALLSANEIDTVLAPLEEIKKDADSEAFYDLRDILPEDLYKRVESRTEWLQPTFYDYDTEDTIVKEAAPYAINVTDFVKKTSSYDVRVEYYLGIVINGQHPDNSVKMIEYMMDVIDGVYEEE